MESYNLETFSIVWLGTSVNNTDENIETRKKLRASINHVQIFEDEQLCENYIRSLDIKDRIILIVNNELGSRIVPRIHQLRQISSIYVYLMGKTENQQWTKEFTKIKGITESLKELVVQIQSHQNHRSNTQVDEILPISIFSVAAGQEKSTTGMNGQFVHSQLLIDCLLRMKSTDMIMKELIAICKDEYQGNIIQLNILNEFQQEYSSDRAVWWYTRNSFLYRILNKALRVQNIDHLFLLRFVIRDLEEQLKKNKCSSAIRLYRGQLMSHEEVQMLQESIGRLISINSFLSTSTDRQVALAFLTTSSPLDDTQRVLFDITADPQLANTKAFADITGLSYYPQEQEILMSLGSIFRLVNVNCDSDGIWVIQVELYHECDQELKPVLDQMKKQYGGDSKETDLLSFSMVLLGMGEYEHVEKYLYRLLHELSKDDERTPRCYDMLGHLARVNHDLDMCLEWYRKSLKIKRNRFDTDDSELAKSYVNIGIIHREKGDLILALKAFKIALASFQKAYGDEHPSIARCLNSMGNVYRRMENYLDAMDCFQKALAINEKNFSTYYWILGISHNAIADTYRCVYNYNEAIQHAGITLKIFEKSLTPRHYRIACTLQILGSIYETRKEYIESLNYYLKAADIYHETLPATNYHIISIEMWIARVSPYTHC